MSLIDRFHRFKIEPQKRYFIILACIIGSAYGFYYYKDQLISSPVYYWPFIPDCPFFSLMYLMVLIAYPIRKRNNLFDVFTFIGLNKVGLWTLFVLVYDFDYYFSPETRVFRSVLFLMHIGMILCAFTLIKDIRRPDASHMGLLLAVFLIMDYFDYIVGTHPYLHTTRLDVIGLVALVLTLGCWGIVWLIHDEKPGL